MGQAARKMFANSIFNQKKLMKSTLSIISTAIVLAMAVLLNSCNKGKGGGGMNGAFTSNTESKSGAGYDLDEIHNSGELIIATLSGPDTYYDYQGQPMGVQYAFAANFASQEGLRVRVETAHDTAGLVKLLNSGEADIIALPMNQATIKKDGLVPAGVKTKGTNLSWAVRKDATDLAEALNGWYGEGIDVTVEKAERLREKERNTVRRKVRAPFISKEKGIISVYDNHFKSAAARTGWDWRLLAAQCYQESGFDPDAISWAGARGLMQVMPSTAAQMGVPESRLFSPEDNINAAAKYISHLKGLFQDVRGEERTKFVLAAYNGGAGHVRDAMALARKYGKNQHSWAEVKHFVRGLSQARYYRDPVVRYGYMIGNETANYVDAVWERWRAYGGRVASISEGNFRDGAVPASHEGRRPHKRNRFSKDVKIYGPDSPELKGE